MRFTALAAKGLEEVVAGELRGLGLLPGPVGPGAVGFQGSLVQAYRAVVHLRTARRLLLDFGDFPAADGRAYYEGVRALPWEEFLTKRHTFAVEASVRDSFTGHSGYAALRAKDAVADRCRQALGARPDVDREGPAVRVCVRLAEGRCSVGLDLAGRPLHKRGYRVRPSPAALNETLAAGLLLLLEYDGERPFCDPFCGSGTLAVEAALIASRTAPGLVGGRAFALERWPGFDRRAWERVLDEAREARRAPPCPVWASDKDPGAVRAAAANAAAAGAGAAVSTACRDALRTAPPGDGGLLASNLPYGDHAGVGENLGALYAGFGDALKRRWAGWKAGLLCGEPSLAKRIGLRPARRVPLWNGPAEVRLLVFDLYEGSRRR